MWRPLLPSSQTCAFVSILTPLIIIEKCAAQAVSQLSDVLDEAIFDLAVLAYVGISVNINFQTTENELKAFNPMNNSSLNNNRIKQLGYRDSFTVEEGLKHTVYILKELMG